MFKWFAQYRKASPQTRYFILNWALYGIVLLVTTIYCYARLDYVRSYKINPPTMEKVKQAAATQIKS